VGQGLLISQGFWITHNDAPQSVGLLWTSGQLVAETSTWQRTQHSQQTNIHAPVGLETTFSAGEGPQTFVLDWAATETGKADLMQQNYLSAAHHVAGFIIQRALIQAVFISPDARLNMSVNAPSNKVRPPQSSINDLGTDLVQIPRRRVLCMYDKGVGKVVRLHG
jgi:hypothetical protein